MQQLLENLVEKLYTKKTKIIGKNSNFAKKPFIRGVLMLFESLVIGVKELTFSANQAGEEDEKLSHKEAVFTTLFSLALGIGIFYSSSLIGWKFCISRK